MKRIASLLLAAAFGCLALAACGAPAASSALTAPASSESDSPSLPAGVKPLEMLRGPMGMATDEFSSLEGMHIIECLDLNGNGPALMTFYDYNTMEQRILCDKPGCAHSDATCPAYMPTTYQGNSARCYLLGIVDSVLYWVVLEGPYDAPTSVALQKQVLDGGSFPETIAQLDPTGWTNVWPGAVFCDGENFYLIQRQSVFARIAMDDGETTDIVPELPAGEFGGQFLGASTDGMALYFTSGDGNRDQIFGVDSRGNTEPLFTLPEASGTMSFCQGLLYYCDITDGSIYAFDPAARETRLLTTALAPYAREGVDGYREAYGWQFQRLGDWLLVDGVRLEENADDWWRVGVDLATGEVRTDLELGCFWNGYVHPLPIWAETPHGLLVTPEKRRFVYHGAGSDGSPYDQETDYDTYALLAMEDFLANRPAYREIASLPHN